MEVSALLICQDATIPFCRKSKGLRYAQVPERSKDETRAELDLFLTSPCPRTPAGMEEKGRRPSEGKLEVRALELLRKLASSVSEASSWLEEQLHHLNQEFLSGQGRVSISNLSPSHLFTGLGIQRAGD